MCEQGPGQEAAYQPLTLIGLTFIQKEMEEENSERGEMQAALPGQLSVVPFAPVSHQGPISKSHLRYNWATGDQGEGQLTSLLRVELKVRGCRVTWR